MSLSNIGWGSSICTGNNVGGVSKKDHQNSAISSSRGEDLLPLCLGEDGARRREGESEEEHGEDLRLALLLYV